MMLIKSTFIAVIILYMTTSHAAELVKKSNSGICHDSTSSYYTRTKAFTAFDSMQSCLNSGGKQAKGKKSTSTKAHPSSASKYSREKFGPGWADLDSDCKNSRVEALIEQSVGNIRYKDENKCQVVGGKWISPYSGETIFNASDIDIDHVVPLKFAWLHGANAWERSTRIKFANDPANLLSVEASLNRQKGAKGLGEWLPPKNQCQYILRFYRIVKLYSVELTSEEKQQYDNIKKQYCN